MQLYSREMSPRQKLKSSLAKCNILFIKHIPNFKYYLSCVRQKNKIKEQKDRYIGCQKILLQFAVLRENCENLIPMKFRISKLFINVIY